MKLSLKKIRFETSPIALSVVVITWLICVAITNIFFDIANILNQSETILYVIPILIAFFSPGIIITWSFLVHKNTIYTEEGISRPAWFRRKEIFWKNIIKAEKKLFQIIITHTNGKLVIYLLLYKDPDEVTSYLKGKITEHLNLPR